GRGCRTQLGRIIETPNQAVRIEEYVHHVYSSNSSSGSSKCSIDNTVPRIWPSFRGSFDRFGTVTSLATTSPFSVICSSSPGTCFLISSGNFDWASWSVINVIVFSSTGYHQH